MNIYEGMEPPETCFTCFSLSPLVIQLLSTGVPGRSLLWCVCMMYSVLILIVIIMGHVTMGSAHVIQRGLVKHVSL